MKRKNTRNEAATLPGVPTPLTLAEANAQFVKSIKPLDGGNSHAFEFVQIMDILVHNKPSFCIDDARSVCKCLDLSPEEITMLFNAYTEKLCQWRKLESIPTIGYNPLFIRIF